MDEEERPRFQVQVSSWGLVSVLATWVFTAGMLYAGIQEQTKATAELSGTVRSLAAQVAVKDVKDAEHDAKIAEQNRRLDEHGARISTLEGRR